MSYTYEYPRPGVTVDIVLFAEAPEEDPRFPGRGKTTVLLIRRRDDPFKDHWAIPGGFVNENEDLAVAAARELGEEAEVENVPLRQVFAVGTPHRDPRGHVISIVFAAHLKAQPRVKAGDDAVEYRWAHIAEYLNDEPNAAPLAFDHKVLIRGAYNAQFATA